ncbi:hypothetical protein BU15DRAFT_67056 [Melanogaster broomeanus]|nr:hypothetical protein BU15DRAFT_67056 [Melanogaster broomeanus]
MRLWKARLTDKQIVEELQKHIDTSQYGIGLRRTRQQNHTSETIHEAMVELRSMYPKAGTREMISLLFHEKEMSVSRRVVGEYFTTHEPDLVRQRKAGRLQRRRFWAAGVNDIWAVDQHDKWLCFGLALHTGIEPFSGQILWMKVWHSNRNPQLILSYYFHTVEQFGFIPLITQSDPRTENFGIANAQTMLRQMHDPSLSGFVQHRWMRRKKNIMPEIAWSQLRRRFTPGFESLLEQGVEEGWYDIDNTLQLKLKAFPSLPTRLISLHKVLPHGIPELIHTSPEDYNALDFKVTMSAESLDYVRQLYINPSHAVFERVPPSLGACIEQCYNQLNRPPVNRASAWMVYLDLVYILRQRVETLPILKEIDIRMTDEDDDDELPLLEGFQDLPYHENAMHYYMGGVGGGMGLQPEHIQALDAFEEDEPFTVYNDIDAVPDVLITTFSEDSDSDSDCTQPLCSYNTMTMYQFGQTTTKQWVILPPPKYGVRGLLVTTTQDRRWQTANRRSN